MLNVHWQPYHRSGDDARWFAELGPRFVKVVWSGSRPPYASDLPHDAVYIYRDYGVESQHRPLLSVEPEELATLHAAACAEASWNLAADGIPASRQLFEAMNEPAIWAEETPDRTTRYNVAFLEALHSRGLHGVALNLSVGWPDNRGPDTPPNWDPFQPVFEAMREGDYLGVHEYWADEGVNEKWGWWAGRVLKCPFNVPILITECGIDSGVKYPGTWDGWAAIYKGMSLDQAAARFVDELWDYMGRMAQDPRIQGVFPFTYDSASQSKWSSFEQAHSQLKDAIRDKWAVEPIPTPKTFVWAPTQPPTPVPAPAPTPPSPPLGIPALGVDVSEHQDKEVRWAELQRSGYSFAFIRLSHGFTLDAHAWRHLNQSEGKGLLRGVYHYLESKYGGRQQARFFHALWSAQDLELPPVVDVESEALTPQQVRDFVERFHELSGRWPMIYTSKFKWERIVGWGATWAKECPLWVAHYDVEEPAVPGPWTDWEFWQYGVHSGPGYSKGIDRDRYSGTAEELWAKYGEGPAPELPVPAAGPQIEFRDGLPYIVGDYPTPGVMLTLSDPWGNSQAVRAGAKPEYGPGGFLFNAWVLTEYTLATPDGVWKVPAQANKTTWLSWEQG